jgi:hypothetical protein
LLDTGRASAPPIWLERPIRTAIFRINVLKTSRNLPGISIFWRSLQKGHY